MEIERAASAIVEAATTPEPRPAHTQAPTEMTQPNRTGKPLRFSDVEGATQHDLDAMIGDQVKPPSKPPVDDDFDEEEDFGDEDDSDLATEESDESEDELDEEAEDSEDADPEDEAQEENDQGDLIEVKVNGKLRKFTLEQMKTLVASGWHTKEKYDAFEAEKTTLSENASKQQAYFAALNAKISPAWEKLQANDIQGAFLELASTRNLNTLDVTRRLRQQIFPEIVELLGLAPEEVRQRLEQNQSRNQWLATQEENSYLKQERERILKEREAQSQPDPQRQAAEELRAKQTEHGISNSDLKWAAQWLAQQGVAETEISVDRAISTILDKKVCDRAVEAVLAARPKLVKDPAFVDRVVRKVKANPDWTTSKAARWVEKQARQMSSVSSQNKETELAKGISRKALQGKSKERFENPKPGQTKRMKFSDFGEGEELL
jgi:hypothetical protein